IKPSNLILTRSVPGVRVLDFGLSKMHAADWSDGGSVLTRASHLLGTPAYMAPEQIRDPRGVTSRCDVYSLGIVLYQAATGRLPYRGDEETIPAAHLDDQPAAAPELPDEVMHLLVKCLAKDPLARPAAADLAAELAALARREGAPPAEELI